MHFLVAGVPGTGKTIAFRALCESVFNPGLRRVLGGSDRAIVYDPKQEYAPILDLMAVPSDEIAILNPFDRRCHFWNLANDYTDPASAAQLAKSIIPVRENLSQPFFAKASAAILAAVISDHIRTNPGRWDLADIIQDCLSEDSVRERLRSADRNPYNRAALTSMARGDTSASVLAELSTAVSDFLPIASRWRKAKQEGRSLSISQFLNLKSGLIVLGANRQYSESLSCINRLFLKRFSELSLDNPDNSLWNGENRIWLLLDELKELGKVQNLAELISKGRGMGICAVLGFQDISGLKEAFGEHSAKEITACCHHKLFLKLGGESAEWASKSIGQTEVLDVTVAIRSGTSLSFGSSSGNSSSTSNGYTGTVRSWQEQSGTSFSATLSSDVTVSRQSKVKEAVLASEISGLPTFGEAKGMTGFICEYSEQQKGSVVRRFSIPQNNFEFLDKKSDIAGFEPWTQGDQLEW